MAMRLTKEILASIPSGALSAVLREHGWRELTSNRPALSLWAPAEGSDPSELVLVPLDHTFDDFTLRLSEAIRRLARVLELTPDELAQDLITAASDILRFRADHETRSDGSIPLIDGVPLFQGIRGALLASAKAVEERRSYFGNAYWKQAQAFLRHARLGQTETGSYVVKVLARAATPETADVGDQVVTPGIDSRDRATVLMLLRAFAAARDATATFREGGEFTVFGDAVEDGVSADLCDAIVLMVDVETSHGVRIDATWSPLAHTPAAVPTQIKFSSEDIEPLKEASKRLRAGHNRLSCLNAVFMNPPLAMRYME